MDGPFEDRAGRPRGGPELELAVRGEEHLVNALEIVEREAIREIHVPFRAEFYPKGASHFNSILSFQPSKLGGQEFAVGPAEGAEDGDGFGAAVEQVGEDLDGGGGAAFDEGVAKAEGVDVEVEAEKRFEIAALDGGLGFDGGAGGFDGAVPGVERGALERGFEGGDGVGGDVVAAAGEFAAEPAAHRIVVGLVAADGPGGGGGLEGKRLEGEARHEGTAGGGAIEEAAEAREVLLRDVGGFAIVNDHGAAAGVEEAGGGGGFDGAPRDLIAGEAGGDVELPRFAGEGGAFFHYIGLVAVEEDRAGGGGRLLEAAGEVVILHGRIIDRIGGTVKHTEGTIVRERAVIVGIGMGRGKAYQIDTDEIESLAETAGAVVVGKVLQQLDRPHAATLVGAGKIAEIKEAVQEKKLDLVIFDRNLTPAQTRNLEKAIGRRVIDRTELILAIFATHARTGEAKAQVELAQLEYAMPRLRAMWSHLGQQVGGGPGAVAGAVGAGVRGPGEKQLEIDRRLARDRITSLKRELQTLQKRKEREVRARAAEHNAVSLVGYTNAGKSTLMNRLTAADVLVDDKLFSTLDTRTRLWSMASGLKILLSDTVGFIRDLPHDLVSSFHATLEEVSQADVLLHVVDASQAEMEAQIRAVNDVLREIEVGDKEVLLVFNKVDRFRDPIEIEILQRQYPGSVALSASTGSGVEVLEARVTEILSKNLRDLTLAVPASDGRAIAEIYESCVVSERRFDGDKMILRVRAPARNLWRLEPFIDGKPS